MITAILITPPELPSREIASARAVDKGREGERRMEGEWREEGGRKGGREEKEEGREERGMKKGVYRRNRNKDGQRSRQDGTKGHEERTEVHILYMKIHW